MELDRFRDVDLVIDHVNDRFNFNPFVSQNDNDGRTLTAQVTNGGVIGEIPGIMMNLRWSNQSSGLTDLSAFELIDKKTSTFQIKYPKNMLNPGKVVASIQIIQNGQVSHSKQFEITVQQLVGEVKGIIDKAEYGALVEVLADSNKFRTDINTLETIKADKTDVIKVEDMISKMPSATPKETFSNLAALQAKYPTGDTSAMVVLESDGKTGYVYLWDGSAWKKGALYQSQGIPDNGIGNKKLGLASVTQEKTDFLGLEKNKLNPKRIVQGGYVDPATGGIINNNGYSYYAFLPVDAGDKLWIQSDFLSKGRAFRTVCCYDMNMNVLGSDGWDNVNSDYAAFAIPDGVCFVTVSFNSSYLSSPLMVCIGDSFTEFEEYKEVLGDSIVLGKNQLQDIEKSEFDGASLLKDKSLPVSKTAFFETNENLFEIGSQKVGYYMNPDGTDVPNGGYYRTKSYQLKKGESISVRSNTDRRVHMRKVTVFDAMKNPLAEYGLDVPPSNGGISTYTAENDAIESIIISISNSTSNYGVEPENLMISYGEVPLSFTKQMQITTPDISVSPTQMEKIREELKEDNSKLKGLTVVGTGDSIQAGDGNKGVGFTEIAASQLRMICKDYALGGATFCKSTRPENNIVDQLTNALQNESKAPDFLVTNGLTNDISPTMNSPLGVVTNYYDVSEYDLSTFSGSMEYYFYQARTQWPTTKIIYVRVHNMATRVRDKQIEFGERAEEICNKWSVPVVNVYRNGNMNTNIPEHRKLYSNPTEASPNGDSTHPNQLGYDRFYVPLLINQLKTI